MCIILFEVESIYGAYEEKKGKISRFNGAPDSIATRRVEGNVDFCEDDGRFYNGSDRYAIVRSGKKVVNSFVME